MIRLLRTLEGTFLVAYLLLLVITMLMGDVWTIRLMGLVLLAAWAWYRWPDRILGFVTAGKSNRSVVVTRVEGEVTSDTPTPSTRRFWQGRGQ